MGAFQISHGLRFRFNFLKKIVYNRFGFELLEINHSQANAIKRVRIERVGIKQKRIVIK